MASDSALASKFQDAWASTQAWLNEQLWFQQAKAKWDELDPQSRTYLIVASFAASLLLVLFIVLSFVISVSSLKSEVLEKQELLTMIRSSSDELHKLREVTSSIPTGGQNEPWPAYFETQAGTAGIGKPQLTISEGKPGAKSEQTAETLFDVSVKGIGLRQLVRYTYALENGQRPVKVRNLVVESKQDPAEPGASLNATLSLSGFAILTPAGGK